MISCALREGVLPMRTDTFRIGFFPYTLKYGRLARK